jgi:murein DD-endopeptidase MepM/ murein hydrolase activator NlpD
MRSRATSASPLVRRERSWLPIVVLLALVAAVIAVVVSGSSGDPWASVRLADGFDFPVGPPDARGYYDAQPFGRDQHLGNDWNGVGGGNTDLGDPVHAIAGGVVSSAAHEGKGWGNVVRVVHRYRWGGRTEVVESLYAHLDRIDVRKGERVRRGQVIGTIGTADGAYLAHLHLEVRERPGLPLGEGYAVRPQGQVDPTAFIRRRRPAHYVR